MEQIRENNTFLDLVLLSLFCVSQKSYSSYRRLHYMYFINGLLLNVLEAFNEKSINYFMTFLKSASPCIIARFK